VILAKDHPLYQFTRPPGIIFDFDGVLVDSLDVHLWAWNQAALQMFRQPLENPESLKGKSTRAIAGVICQRFGQKKLSAQLALLKNSLLLEGAQKAPLLPGARKIVDDCLRLGVPLAVGSNSSRTFVRSVLQFHQMKLPVVLGFEDSRRPKPHPDVFLACAKMLEIDERQWKQILVFEDSLHGIEAALRAHMLPYGIASFHPAGTLIKAGALNAFANFNEISFATD
jgi:beta-phosphoglucomutase